MDNNKIIVSGRANNIVIQQGCNNSSQNLYFQNNNEYSNLAELFSKIVDISKEEIFDRQMGEYSKPAKDAINSINKDIVLEKPLPIVKEGLISLKSIVENASGSLIASGILSILGEILQ